LTGNECGENKATHKARKWGEVADVLGTVIRELLSDEKQGSGDLKD
jgi:hypothetical protein